VKIRLRLTAAANERRLQPMSAAAQNAQKGFRYL
jgi:hypothetical protein